MAQRKIDDHQQIADAAFDRALESGRLSHHHGADNFVADYMFMGTDPVGKDHFKHRMTRRYLP